MSTIGREWKSEILAGCYRKDEKIYSFKFARWKCSKHFILYFSHNLLFNKFELIELNVKIVKIWFLANFPSLVYYLAVDDFLLQK